MLTSAIAAVGATIDKATSIALDDATRAKCLKVLREAFRADEFWPSMHAAEALTLAGYGDEVRTGIEPRLKTEKDARHRCGLARELVRAGDRAKAALLLDILADEDSYGHVHACESLYKVNEIGDGRLLRQALTQTEDLRKALMAAAALGRWGSPSAMALLRRHVKDRDPEIARIAAWVLARIGDRQDIPALRAGLQRFNDPLVRAFFEHALAALGDAGGLEALARNLSSPDASIRTFAAVFAGDARATSLAPRLQRLLDDDNVDVRVRAAQSLLVLSQPAPPNPRDVFARDVYKATAQNPRYSEGDIVALRDGSLLYATTEFFGSGADHARARIIARRSTDGGRTWNEPRVLQQNVGRQNVMSVTLRRLAYPVREDTPIGLFYLVKNSASDLKVYLRISHDEARTFGEPILVSDMPGYHVMNNDRVTLLSSGRLIAPIAWTKDVRRVNHFVSFCFFSDDGGQTWHKSGGQVDYAKRGAMEPEVLERNDGRLLMTFRTQLGHIGAAYSTDGGDTWSKPESWNVRAPEAPATLRRIPSTGDLLLIWIDNYEPGAGHGGRRTPLAAAISKDEGRTWVHKRNIEADPNHGYGYVSITFWQGRVLLSYYVRDPKTRRISSRFRSVPIAWFYEAGGPSSK
ncbi:MAG: sialidase [Planctomycetes bacterium]|nr:sialidase [Planctomycetota bacterium]